ncbi:hypothetical protein [Methanobrevibacter arboriphilus]|uniref:Uncharacterized protein n=1 Tax=Methanobrevibacter arboriphilus TaxID=39441 RepID=A0ACA8R512_METAZ|nr:hypothetical protein [Methanobrevibacter arboriphilus]BBL62644.1 hypothetical protein MarbSA_16840 [Methanobrevibacter arboriphilus]
MNKKIILGIIIAIIAIIGVVAILGSNTSESNIQDDIVGQGNPSCDWSEQDTGIKVEKWATVFQWFESKSGTEYKDVKIKVDLYKNDKIIASKNTVISSLKEPQNIFVTIDVNEEPDYAKTTVINATPVSK